MNTENPNEEINLRNLFCLWWEKRRLILLLSAAGGIVAAGIAFCLPKEYTSSVKIITETDSRSILPDLSGLTSLVGINLDRIQPEENLNAALYPDVVASTPFLAEMSRITVSGMPLSVYLPGFKHDSVQLSDTLPQGREQYRLLDILRKQISVHTDKKSGITTVSAVLNDSQAAAVTADSTVSKLRRYLDAHRTRKAQENLAFTEARFGEAREKYYTSQQAYARFSDANRYISKESAGIERDRLHQEQQLAYNLYSQWAMQLESARLKVQEQSLQMTVIEPAVAPIRHSFPKRSLIILAGLLLGAGIPLLFISVREFFKNREG